VEMNNESHLEITQDYLDITIPPYSPMY
jgi:hypothetical protein